MKRLESLRKQQEQLAERIKLEAGKERTRERKRDTRRKILLGALLDAWIKEDSKIASATEIKLKGFLKKRLDFEVFDMEVPADVLRTEDEEGAAAQAKVSS
jgi:ribosomal protein S4